MKKLLVTVFCALLMLSCISAAAAKEEFIDMGGGVTRKLITYAGEGNGMYWDKVENPQVKDGVLTIPYMENSYALSVSFTYDNDNGKDLKKVYIENGYRLIFSYFGEGVDVYLPASVERFDDPSVDNIFVDSSNPYLCGIDGVLFSKDKTVLKIYGSGRSQKSYNVPEGVVKIERIYNESIDELTFPSTLKEIDDARLYDMPWYKKQNMLVVGDGLFIGPCRDEVLVTPPEAKSIASCAFSDCSFKSVHIGSSVKTIYSGAFYRCSITDGITIEEGVEVIYDAFRSINETNNHMIKEIVIPESVKIMSGNCFDHSRIENIFFPADCEVLDESFSVTPVGRLYVKRGSKLHSFMSSNGCLCYDIETKEPILPEYKGDYYGSRDGKYQIGIWDPSETEIAVSPCTSEHEWRFEGDKRAFVAAGDLYVPLRLTCEKFNIPLYWNSELGIAEVGERCEVEPSGEAQAIFGNENLVRYNGKIAKPRTSVTIYGLEDKYKKGNHSAMVIDGSIYVPLIDLADSGLLPGYRKNYTSQPKWPMIIQ